jgi:hypothetical protein
LLKAKSFDGITTNDESYFSDVLSILDNIDPFESKYYLENHSISKTRYDHDVLYTKETNHCDSSVKR